MPGPVQARKLEFRPRPGPGPNQTVNVWPRPGPARKFQAQARPIPAGQRWRPGPARPGPARGLRAGPGLGPKPGPRRALIAVGKEHTKKCYSGPCENGATCLDRINSYECFCVPGYNGDNCEHIVVDGGWGAWSTWGECSESCGRGAQIRHRQCNNPSPMNGGNYCLGSSTETLPCTCDPKFDAAAACDRRMATGGTPGYFEDRCDCYHYYVCMRLTTGWKAIRMPCPKCLMWSQSSYTCGVFNQNCFDNTESTTTASVLKEITCVDFESGWNGMRATNGIYIASPNVKIKSRTAFGRSAYFNGVSANLRVPRFASSYSTFGAFAISFWYKRLDTTTVVQGLITNGDCTNEPSILILSGKDSLDVKFATATSHAVQYNDIPSSVNVWHHVVLSYDGDILDIYVDKAKTQLGTAQGRILEKSCPMVIGHANAAEEGRGYFRGYMDQLCFYDRGLTASDVHGLYETHN
ncbi:hypothetical protein LSAT2_021736 [Lamellibrachia satsuma]|nr:hypothetical protein LSAT2_021736 [Lamellibrachia satsuma]